MISAVAGPGELMLPDNAKPLPVRETVLPTRLPLAVMLAEPDARMLECGAYTMPSHLPVLPEMLSPVLVVLTLANISIPCEYGLKFMEGEEMLIEPVATRVTVDGTVVLRPLEKLMLPFT